MDNKKSLGIVVLVLICLIAGANVLYDKLGGQLDKTSIAETKSSNQNEEPQYQLAPDFLIYDTDGNEVRLSDFIGKPVIINFWASWCGPCKSEMADFEKAYQQYGEDIQFLMVNMTDGSRETVETASAYVEKNGYTFPVCYDTAYSAAEAYSVYSLPTTYFIDAEGYAIAYASSAINLQTIEQGIDMITKE